MVRKMRQTLCECLKFLQRNAYQKRRKEERERRVKSAHLPNINRRTISIGSIGTVCPKEYFWMSCLFAYLFLHCALKSSFVKMMSKKEDHMNIFSMLLCSLYCVCHRTIISSTISTRLSSACYCRYHQIWMKMRTHTHKHILCTWSTNSQSCLAAKIHICLIEEINWWFFLRTTHNWWDAKIKLNWLKILHHIAYSICIFVWYGFYSHIRA